MFNNIIYFIIVLLIFNISYPDISREKSLTYSISMMFICWVVFAFYCSQGFKRLLNRYGRESGSLLTGGYHTLVLRFSILSIFLFILDVYIFHLKYWLQIVPGVKEFSVFQGVIAIGIFLFYLSTIWYFSHTLYNLAFQANIKRKQFIISNLKINVPILFPWLVISFVYDLILISPWSGPENLLGQPIGQIIFFGVFLTGLMVFMPPFIQYWWGCRPFDPSGRINELKEFLKGKGFRYRELMRWPVFEGRMMTAGIMGIIPQYRYILMTDSLMEILTIEELKAVLAHEMGHSKYRHLLFYVLFFLGYIAISFRSFEIFSTLLVLNPVAVKFFEIADLNKANLFYFILSIPIILTMVIYFRFLMGFFMRHFERQADLYSAVTMGSPAPTIGALEKIAMLSGKSRNIPSWHHFSIKERVDCLWRYLKEPGLVKRHNRLLGISLGAYIICIVALGYFLNFSPVKQDLDYRLYSNAIRQQLSHDPGNVTLLKSLAMICHETGRIDEAIQIYERALLFDGSDPDVLNNLAWILATSTDTQVRNSKRAVLLAEKAVAIESSPMFLDTLAEAYWADGSFNKAVETIKKAIALDEDNPYYKEQLEKFLTSQ